MHSLPSYSAFEPIPILEQIVNAMQQWRERGRATASRVDSAQSRTNSAAPVSLMLFTPSFLAEAAPLFLLRHAHIPVWEMSALMAGAWAGTSWLTWIISNAIEQPVH